MAAFATIDDVEIRAGRELTVAEAEQAEQVIGTVTSLICDAAGQDAEWAADLDPVPGVLTAVCVERVVAAIANPSGLAAESERLGEYEHSLTFPREGGGIYLTPAEQLQVSRAVNGTNVSST